MVSMVSLRCVALTLRVQKLRPSLTLSTWYSMGTSVLPKKNLTKKFNGISVVTKDLVQEEVLVLG